MPTKAKNIAIAQPRSYPRRPNIPNTIGATFKYTNSVMNSYYYNGFGLFGSASSSNRKQTVYTNSDSTAVSNQKHRQANLEANVGQMDRINRIKAMAIQASN